MDKIEALKKLESEMTADKTLPLTTNLVFGEGNPDCEIMFFGEAPGQVEDMQKRPFVGRAGQLLRQCLRELGWKEADVYITNIVKRRPPENRDPLPEEIGAYQPYLTEQIEIINPKIIVALGRFAMNYFLPTAKISRDRGKVFRAGGRLIVPIYHPAAALRGNEAMAAFRDDFRKLPAILKQYDKLITAVPVASVAAKKSAPPQAKLF